MLQDLLRVIATPLEGSIDLPVDVSLLRFVNRSDGNPVRVSFVSGEVAEGAGLEVPYTTFRDAPLLGPLSPLQRKVYFAADYGGAILELYLVHSDEPVSLGSGWSNGFGI